MSELWAHQKEALERAKEAREFGFFFEPGLGKSRVVVELIRHRWNTEQRKLRTLILSPLITLENWRNEILKFSKIPASEIQIMTGSSEKRVAMLKEEKSIRVLNYEGLLMENLIMKIVKWNPEILICDESQKVKSITAKRTKRAYMLAEFSKYRYILTGTPILNSPMDIFSQFLILDLGETFGKNFYSFRAKYFYDRNANMPRHTYFPNWQIRNDSYIKMNNAIAKKTAHAKKEDALDLPPLVKKIIALEMTNEQKKLYEDMKKDFVAFVQNLGKTEVSVAELAITKALRLMQIVSGFLKTETGSEIALKENPKITALRELFEEITPSHKVLVWAVFHENYKQIRELCESMGLEYVEVHGGINNTEKFKNVEAFTKDPEVKVLIWNPLSGGIGINLVEASYSIFYSRNFSLEADIQAESRNHRGGSERHEKITRIDLIMSKTLDEVVYNSLASKQEIGEKLLRAIALEM